MSELASVGHHFMLGLRPTTTLDPLDRALLADLKPAGVVFFKSNFPHDLPYAAWLDSHAALIADIREATGRERLFIAIDHEGGRRTHSAAKTRVNALLALCRIRGTKATTAAPASARGAGGRTAP